MGLNDEAWAILFERYNILSHITQNGFYEIDANTIKTVREPRLMAKFDHKINLPDIFRKNGLSILPISRSRYIIGEYDAYQTVSYSPTVTPTLISFPEHITSIDPTHLYSESAALHCAYVSGMIDDLIGELSLPTISGRMSSSSFDFLIRSKTNSEQHINITKSQVEIDAGYESDNHLFIVECILEHEVFHRSLNDYLQTGHQPTVPRIVHHMKTCKVFGVHAESTYHRRAQTVLKWVDWILGLQSV